MKLFLIIKTKILTLYSCYLRSKISNLKVQQYEYCHLIMNKNSSKSIFVIVTKHVPFEINSFLLVILIVGGRNDKNMKKISMIIAARSLYNSFDIESTFKKHTFCFSNL